MADFIINRAGPLFAVLFPTGPTMEFVSLITVDSSMLMLAFLVNRRFNFDPAPRRQVGTTIIVKVLFSPDHYCLQDQHGRKRLRECISGLPQPGHGIRAPREVADRYLYRSRRQPIPTRHVCCS